MLNCQAQIIQGGTERGRESLAGLGTGGPLAGSSGDEDAVDATWLFETILQLFE
jgi:hypothetical protein